MKASSSGFTLIELVVVIIVLGILAVIAAPQFINLSKDSKVAAIESAQGTIKESLRLLHMRAQIDGKLGSDVTVQTQYGLYQFYRGYPETKSESTNPNLYFFETFVDIGTATNVDKNNTRRIATYGQLQSYEDNGFSRIGYGEGNLLAEKCYAEYQHTSAFETVKIDVSGC